MSVLVCGHIDVNEEVWEKYYVPELEKLDPNIEIYTGGAEGSDLFTQKYCFNHDIKLKLCDRGIQNNIRFNFSKLEHINGFGSYTGRDEYMVEKCNELIGFLYKRVMSLGSGSFRNIIQLKLGKEIAELFQQHARSKSWNSINECINTFDHKEQDNIRKLSDYHMVIL